jgi:hypothetical protein
MERDIQAILMIYHKYSAAKQRRQENSCCLEPTLPHRLVYSEQENVLEISES